jgi:CheY-like chemotaxis protein
VAVLVVDDEPDARDMVAAVLRSKGAEVTTAASGREALQCLASRGFSVMVSDIGMPLSDGYELITSVRAAPGDRSRRLRAIALTAYSREEDRRRALDAGFQAYIAKPVEPDALVELVYHLATAGHTDAAARLS